MANRDLHVTATQEELNGLGVEAMRASYATFGLYPEAGKLSLQARATWSGTAMRGSTHIGPFSLDGNTNDRGTRNYVTNYDVFGEFPGGADAGPEPLESVMGALCACITQIVAWHASRMGVEIERMQAKAGITYDGQEFLFCDGDPKAMASALGKLQWELEIAAPNASADQLAELERMARACPVCALICGEVEVEGVFTQL